MRPLASTQRIQAVCAFVVPIALVLLFAPASDRAAKRQAVATCEDFSRDQAHVTTVCHNELIAPSDR